MQASIRRRGEAHVATRSPISFKRALANFKTEIDRIEPEAGKLDSDDKNHLKRWREDYRAEQVWQKVQRLAWGPAESYDPLDGFIASILAARRMAEAIPIANRMRERHRNRSVRHLERARQLEELAKTWKMIADSKHPNAMLALNRAKQYEDEAQWWRMLSQKPPPEPLFKISRKDRGGSRKQRAFMQLVGEYIIQICGKALDSEVAILNDIAFDTQEATSAFQARSARKSTTQRGRLERKAQQTGQN
jgi:hypothetical protein